MLFTTVGLAALAMIMRTSSAYPRLATQALEGRQSPASPYGCPAPFNGPDVSGMTLAERLGEYQAPGPDDSRGPCPGLNTLANHGLINRNGKDISSDDVFPAFARGFGICGNGIEQALHNWEVVCEYTTGATCGVPENNGTFILKNLTLLGEPHAFEHDHSFSRQDYRQNYAYTCGDGPPITDNIYFNHTEFQSRLDEIPYQLTNPLQQETAHYEHFNQMRLQAESIQYQSDFPGWFKQNLPTQLFEVGFIFGAMFDRDQDGNQIGEDPVVRLDWWAYWFQEESFPTHLSWVPAQSTHFEINFIQTVSSKVLSASWSTTPTGLDPAQPATVTTAPPASNLPQQDVNPTYELFNVGQGQPYAAPTPPSGLNKRAVEKRSGITSSPAPTNAAGSSSSSRSVYSLVASLATARPDIITSAYDAMGPAPTAYDLYQQYLDLPSLSAQIGIAESYQRAVVDAVTSIASVKQVVS